MDMHSRKEYLKKLQERYIKAGLRKERTAILDEYCQNTLQSRKYVIRRINHYDFSIPEERRKREEVYDGQVKAALAKVWEIFDYPCGQRLAPLLKSEVDRLRQLEELHLPNETARKLKEISPATIDRKLKHQREVLRLLRKKGHPKTQSLLYQRIPVRLNDWDTSVVGNLGIDLVEHCGSSTAGEYIHTLSVTEIASGWWEGEGIMSRGQYPTLKALKKIRTRTPFKWLEIHPDNDSAFINGHLFRYCQAEKLRFTRSRPNKKNDNAYIEQKNWTHVKKVFGYLRYDTQEELEIINDLYENDLQLFKNFFSPVMKLVKKERIGGKVKRKYDVPKTPCQRLLESDYLSKQAKKELENFYLSLNPAQIKREIDKKTQKLFRVYQEKKRSQKAIPFKKQTSRRVTNYMIQEPLVGLPT